MGSIQGVSLTIREGSHVCLMLAISVDPDEVAHDESSPLDLQCLPV